MKSYVALLLVLLLLTGCTSKPDESPVTLRLPITVKPGYGPFYPSFGILSPERPDDPQLGRIYQSVKGVPGYWSGRVKTMIWLNADQLIYQHVKAGNISRTYYTGLQKERNRTPDTTQLSAKPIKCYVYVVRGFDERAGKWAILVDTNNNLDFADETPVYPDIIKPKEIPDEVKNRRTIDYEIYRNGRVETAHASITFRNTGEYFLYNFPRYATASVTLNGRQQELLIDLGLSSLDFEGSTIALPSAVKNGRADAQELVKVGDEIELLGAKYRNNGISVANNVLELEPVDAVAVQTNPLQNGNVFQPFTDVDFSSGNPISLQKMAGKYVFIDFWGTWCKGCVEDMPNLNALYQRVDKNKVEFIGVNCGDSPERLRNFLKMQHTNWPQIRSTAANDLQKRYRVTGFPTSVLLDPQGRILARDLHSDVLASKLAELGQ